jgi:glucose/arabinose dehydrogenase
MHPPRRRAPVVAALLAALLALGIPCAFADTPRYATQGLCAGFPRVALSVPKGWCVGLVADARDGLLMPRRLLEVAPGRFWITDMGQWEPRRGRLLELDVSQPPGDKARLRVLARNLDRPHGLVLGPDRRVYVAEAGTVWRTGTQQVEPEVMIRSLPSDGAHPLKELAFGRQGRLFVNVGSATDACRNEQQQQVLPCPEAEGAQPRAAVYEAVLGGPDFSLQRMQPHARGLRNSLGLAVTQDGAGLADIVWQAENSVDYPDADHPAEELNELKPGAHHGWPYCVSDARGRGVVARGYEGRVRCDRPDMRPPVQAWPAHVAPLQLLTVPPSADDASERPWSGHLLAVWHGYRAKGHRIVGWRIGPDGRPQGEARSMVSGWQSMAGVRPLGSPAGVAVDHRGWLWVVEDRNRTVLVVAPVGAPGQH